MMQSRLDALNSTQKQILATWPAALVNRFQLVSKTSLQAGLLTGLVVALGKAVYYAPDLRHRIAQSKLWAISDGILRQLVLEKTLLFALCLFLVLLLFVSSYASAKRVLASITFGVVSMAPAGFVAVFLLATSVHGWWRLLIVAGGLPIVLSLDFLLSLQAELRRFRTFTRIDLQKPRITVPSPVIPPRRDADDAIYTWNDDVLGRAPLADAIRAKILIGRIPVLAIRGAYGDGKTSLLNLLRRDLQPDAVVIYFSTWLPGSKENLAGDLLSDIAQECRNEYYLPGLARSLRRYARILSADIPYVKGFKELLQPATQREELAEFRKSVALLPKRVVVLLDEIDRMEPTEVFTLLKLIRGTSGVENLTFVCAFDRKRLEIATFDEYNQKTHSFFEKFFPTAVDLPVIDGGVLKKEFLRLISTSQGPFADFSKLLDETWDTSFGAVCKNLRQIRLLANDADIAMSLTAGEIHPVDLISLCFIQRFNPEMYSAIYKNSAFLTYGQIWLKSRQRYLAEDQQEELSAKAGKELLAALEERDDSSAFTALLYKLFPSAKVKLGVVSQKQPLNWSIQDLEMARKNKRICHPDYFPIYFRFQVPDIIVSVRDFQLTIDALGKDVTSTQMADRLANDLLSRSSDTLRRLDFLERFLDVRLSRVQEREAAIALSRLSDVYLYDIADIGEAAKALDYIFLAAANSDSDPEATNLLARCVLASKDDTFALRILTSALDPPTDSDRILTGRVVNRSRLEHAFRVRMVHIYRPLTHKHPSDFSTSDPQAFWKWADLSEDDRSRVQTFWQDYVGLSSKRLAFVGSLFFVRYAWSKDPSDFVHKIFAEGALEKIFPILENDGADSDDERRALRWLRRFVAGDFVNGVPMPFRDVNAD